MLRKILDILIEILAVLIDIRLLVHKICAIQQPVEDELLDSSDAKRLLKVGDKTLYRWRKQKLITARLIGNKHYYLKADLVKLLENT